jgi:hypothetical protein
MNVVETDTTGGVIYHSVIDTGDGYAITQCGGAVRLQDAVAMDSVPDEADDIDICHECQRRSHDDPTIRVTPDGGST